MRLPVSMNRLPPVAAAAMLCLLLSACAMFGGSGDKMPEGQCHAAGARDQLGKTLDEHVLAEARAGATALRSRVLPYGAPPDTRDIDPLRLNVEVDEGKRIRRLRCG